MRGSSFLSLGLHERIGLALLELCADFGIADSRGTLLRVALSQRSLANLVGASRPRVTEHLARMERDWMVIRQGRQLVVRAAELEESMTARIPDLSVKILKSISFVRGPHDEAPPSRRLARRPGHPRVPGRPLLYRRRAALVRLTR